MASAEDNTIVRDENGGNTGYEPFASLTIDPPLHPWGYAAGDIISGEILVHTDAIPIHSCHFQFLGKELVMWRDEGGRLHKARRTFLSNDHPIHYADTPRGEVFLSGDIIPFAYTIPHDLPLPTINFPRESEAFGCEIYYVGKVVMLVGGDDEKPIAVEDEDLRLYLTIRAKQDAQFYHELSLRQAWVEHKKKFALHTGSVDFRVRVDRLAIVPSEPMHARVEIHNHSTTATVDSVEVLFRQRIVLQVNDSDTRTLTRNLFSRKLNIAKGGVTPNAIADLTVPIVWREDLTTHDMGFDVASKLISVSHSVVVEVHIPWARMFDIVIPIRVLPLADTAFPPMSRRNSLRSRDMVGLLQPGRGSTASPIEENGGEHGDGPTDASDSGSISSSELDMSKGWTMDGATTDDDIDEADVGRDSPSVATDEYSHVSRNASVAAESKRRADSESSDKAGMSLDEPAQLTANGDLNGVNGVDQVSGDGGDITEGDGDGDEGGVISADDDVSEADAHPTSSKGGGFVRECV